MKIFRTLQISLRKEKYATEVNVRLGEAWKPVWIRDGLEHTLLPRSMSSLKDFVPGGKGWRTGHDESPELEVGKALGKAIQPAFHVLGVDSPGALAHTEPLELWICSDDETLLRLPWRLLEFGATNVDTQNIAVRISNLRQTGEPCDLPAPHILWVDAFASCSHPELGHRWQQVSRLARRMWGEEAAGERLHCATSWQSVDARLLEHPMDIVFLNTIVEPDPRNGRLSMRLPAGGETEWCTFEALRETLKKAQRRHSSQGGTWPRLIHFHLIGHSSLDDFPGKALRGVATSITWGQAKNTLPGFSSAGPGDGRDQDKTRRPGAGPLARPRSQACLFFERLFEHGSSPAFAVNEAYRDTPRLQRGCWGVYSDWHLPQSTPYAWLTQDDLPALDRFRQVHYFIGALRHWWKEKAPARARCFMWAGSAQDGIREFQQRIGDEIRELVSEIESSAHQAGRQALVWHIQPAWIWFERDDEEMAESYRQALGVTPLTKETLAYSSEGRRGAAGVQPVCLYVSHVFSKDRHPDRETLVWFLRWWRNTFLPILPEYFRPVLGLGFETAPIADKELRATFPADLLTRSTRPDPDETGAEGQAAHPSAGAGETPGRNRSVPPASKGSRDPAVEVTWLESFGRVTTEELLHFLKEYPLPEVWKDLEGLPDDERALELEERCDRYFGEVGVEWTAAVDFLLHGKLPAAKPTETK